MNEKTSADRAKTKQDRLESKEHLADETPTPRHAGTFGGDLAEDISSRDEEKRAFERPAGVTRVRKSDELADE